MEKINCYRVKIAQKGYILPSELGKYAGISDAEGFQLYQKLKEMLRPKGEIPFVTIVTVEAVNNYLGLNQDEIESMAEQELKEKTSLLESLKQKWKDMMAQLRKVLKMPDKQTHPAKEVMAAAKSITAKIPQQKDKLRGVTADLKALRATERRLVDEIVSHDFSEAREASDRRRELGLTHAAVQHLEH